MPNTCAVTGNVKSLLGTNIQNCAVKASILTPFFHGTAWISGEIASTTTDSSGNFSLSVIETESVGKKITFTFEYNDGTGAVKLKKYTVIVPDENTVTLSDLVTADESPVTANTFPASSVTVVPTGNLASDDVQDALQELQTDIDTLNTLADGKIYVGNSSNVATEVTPSGDVTISNAGVTAISAGVIVNADVGATAAIAHSKLADITAGSVLMGNGSNVPTATALSGDVTVNSSGVTAIGSGVIVNADVNASAAIDYSKLNLATSIVNADVSASAAIARSKLASGTNYRILANNSSGVMSENAALTAKTVIIADANGQLAGIAPGTSGNVLTSDGTDWTSAVPGVGTPTVTLVEFADSPYTVAAGDDVLTCDPSGGDITLNLPAVASSTGRVLEIKHIYTAGRIQVEPNGAETIDGVSTVYMASPNEAIRLVCDGTMWRKVAHLYSDYQAANGTTTPSAAGAYNGTGVPLTPGDWILHGNVRLDESGGSPGYSNLMVTSWSLNQTSYSAPTVQAGKTSEAVIGASTTYHTWAVPPIRVSVASGTTTIYLITQVQTITTPANARFIHYVYAERVG
jgi:hypothetical protein